MFAHSKPIIGMVHLPPLPGSARFVGSFADCVARAVADAVSLEQGGVDGIMVENFFDAPFHKSNVPKVTVSAMTAAVLAVKRLVNIPVGVNVLRNDVCSALSIACITGARFVRCNVYLGAAVTDQGIIEGAARDVIALRKELGVDVEIWADVDVKHASALGSRSIAELATDAVERGMADAIIVTGPATGRAASMETLLEVKSAVEARVFVGSGVDSGNVQALLEIADGAIVGSSLKEDANVASAVDPAKVRALMAALQSNKEAA